MQMARKLGDIVEITWEDAWADTARFTPDEVAREKPYVGRSAGFLIRDDRQGMAIGRDIFGTRYRDVQFIPRAMIRGVEVWPSKKKRR